MEEQQHNEGGAASTGKGALAKVLLGKVVSHRLFSDSVLYWVMLAATFLVPIFFVPGGTVALEFGKMVMLETLVLFGIFAWSIGRLRDGRAEVPKSMLLLASLLLVVQFVIAAAFSPAPLVSFLGSGYDIGTVSSFVVLFLLMFLSSVVFTDRDRILALYAGLLLSGALVMVYQLLRYFFGADFLSFSLFTSDVSSPVGKWNDLAGLFGAMLLLSLSALYFFPQNKIIRIPAYFILLIGLFFLLLVDFTVLWIILIVLIGVLTALAIYEGESKHKLAKHEAAQSGTAHAHRPLHKRVTGHLPVIATLILVIALIYGTGLSSVSWGKNNLTIASVVSKTLRAAPYSEVVMTPKATYEIISASIKDSPLFGVGPNRFGSSFLLHKTSDFNRTPFWDTSFDFGIGRIPTYFGTTGLIGMLLWLSFIVFLFMKIRHIVRVFAKDRIAAFIAFSLFLLTVYFWSIAFFYLPGVAIFALAFIFAGTLIAFLAGEGALGRYTLTFEGNSRLSIVVVPVVIVVLVGVVASGVLLYRQVSSLVAARTAEVAAAAGDLNAAAIAITEANRLAERDVYHRSMSNIALARLTRMNAASMPTEEFQAQANQLIADARMSAERAVALDPTNFENHLQLGGVYDTLGSLGVKNTADPARQNYEQALRLNPKSPRVLFVLGRLEYSAGDREKAKGYLAQALVERPNYAEAVAFLTQLNIQDKDTDGAIVVLQNAVNAEPTNFLMHFTLGYLYYTKKDYNSAGAQFEAAVLLNPVYADAKYFLGLCYNKLDHTQEAIQQFTDVQTLNPDNQEVASILRNLKAGRDPFAPPYAAPTQAVDDALGGLNKAKSGN